MQDNDPKNTSGYASDSMRDNEINWWKTPAESPDLNLIENLWHEHELKEFIHREAKPKTKDQLIEGIPYSGKFSWKASLQSFHGLIFVDAHTHAHYTLYNHAYFVGLIFADSCLSAKIGSHKNFLLYGS